MKTLIFNGSPRKNGDTASLVEKFVGKLKGEYKLVEAYRCNISPCLDCRYCRENSGCAIDDEMQEIYRYIQECDNILIASPIYFSELTGKLLDVGSRLQTYYCARAFRQEEPVPKPKKGAILLVGGGDGAMDTACKTARILLHHMNCRDIHRAVCSHNTNEKPAIDDENAILGLNGILDFFAEK